MGINLLNKNMEKRILQILNLLAPFMAGAITLVIDNGSGSWEDVFVDESLTKLFTPAPVTFTIWGPIFILVGLFYVYQARDLLPGREEIEMPFVHQVGLFFLFSTIMSTVWFVTWAKRMIWLSIASMIVYLFTILAAYFRLAINLLNRTRRERLFVTAGWSMYAGWVTVAALVNITTGLVFFGFDILPFTELQWTVAASIVAVVVYVLFLFFRSDYIFAGVGAWALIGLSITHLDPASPSNFIVLITYAVGAVVILLSMAIRYVFNISIREGKH